MSQPYGYQDKSSMFISQLAICIATQLATGYDSDQ